MTNVRKLIDKIFDVGVLLKALFGFFEILGGILITVSGGRIINNFLIDMAMDEIARDPNDFLATHFINWSVGIYSDARFFAIFYLLIHGAINIFLAAALLRNKIWAYPWAVAGFGAFIFYQLYKYIHTHSSLILFLTIFDIFIVLVIYLEYKRKIRKTA